ncbi:MAG TPA: hypothetical protein VGB25_06405 [Candidatus Binatia bacterium]
MLTAKWLTIYIVYALGAILLIPLLVATVWIYWWIFKFAQREDVTNPDTEGGLVEKLGGDPSAALPQDRNLPPRFLAGGFVIATWPIVLLAGMTFGVLGVSLVLIFSLAVFWYFWERTRGFCNRVKAVRRRVRAKR